MAYEDLSAAPSADTGRDASPRSVTAFFDTMDAADVARGDLIRAGVPEADLRIAGGATETAEPAHPHGFWESLKDFFIPDEDRHLYAEGLRRGGYALSVQTDSVAYARVIEMLDRDGAVDMEERAVGWRGEGWSGFEGAGALGEREMAYAPAGSGTGGFGASRADQPLFDGPMDTAAIEPGSVVPDAPDSGRVRAGAPDTAYAAAAPGLASPADTARDTTARTGEAQPAPGLAAPFRDLSHGRTRVRSYIGGDLSGAGLPRE
jgi:hypothetical protein